MKILLFRRSIFGEDGSTKVLVWLANKLSEDGHEVVVVSQTKARSKAFYPLNETVRHVVAKRRLRYGLGFWDRTSMKFRGKATNLVEAGSLGAKFMLTYGAFVFTRTIYKLVEGETGIGEKLSSLFSKGSYYSQWKKEEAPAISSLREVLLNERPNLVVSFFTAAHFLIAEAAKRSKTPLICSYNGDPRVYPERIGEKFIELSKVLRPQAFTILNPIFFGDLQEEDRRRAHVIPNYVRPHTPVGQDSKKENVIVSVGRLHPQKNHELLIEAFSRLEKRYPEWRVEIYGEGEHRQELQRRISALGLTDRVVLKGVTRDVDAVYESASIHAFPSLCEGFGLVVIEAMSAGLPGVSIAGVYPSSDFIVQSESGLIAQPDPEDFAAKLEELMVNAPLREKLSKNGISYARNFSSETIMQQWNSLLQRVSNNGLTPTCNEGIEDAPLSAGERLPVPHTATFVPAGSRKKPRNKKTASTAPPTANVWNAPLPSRLGYPRLHPENAYDALDFLRAREVHRLNEEVVQRVRSSVAASGRKVRVGFLVSEKEKWNGDQLIHELGNTNLFECSFAVHLSSTSERLSPGERAIDFEEQVAYFASKGEIRYELFDLENDRALPVESIDYDVVFIQQPWGAKDFPRRLIGRTLCAYMHYGFIMMANHGMHYNICSFHSYLWAYFTQTDLHRKMHVEHDPSAGDKIVVTGYPKLDVYFDHPPARNQVLAWKNRVDARRRVIFAPHHSVERNSLGMATFGWSGPEAALLRARHEDIDWVYKPHPRMALSLERAKMMLPEEYQAYVEEWESSFNSSVYDDGDYFDVFRSSDALITDCGSFLAEYLPTGKPIIWLVSDRTVGLNPVGKFLSQGFYQARTPEQLNEIFQQVVVEGTDPLSSLRSKVIEEILPRGKMSSGAVVDHLSKSLLPN